MKRLVASLLTVGLAAALPAAVAGKEPLPGPAKKANWSVMVTPTAGGHLLGNPDAEVKLVEFMSYTCSHCADFAKNGDGAVRLGYVPTGKVSYEIRHLIRDTVDLTATLATHCGAASKFTGNHDAILSRYDDWMATAKAATQAQKSRWNFGTPAARFQAIASDLGFYEIMERRGYDRPALDACLKDEAKARSIAETSARDIEAIGLEGTPSFVLNGTLLDVYGWTELKPRLDAAL